MSKIKIIADSTCDLSEELISRYDIDINPLFVCLGEQMYRDCVDITPEEVYAWADENKTVPTTSAVSQEETEKLFKKYLDMGYDIFYTGLSSEMSGSYQIAKRVAQEIAPDRIAVYDSLNLSSGVGHVAVYACELAQQGLSVMQIVNKLDEENYTKRIKASFLVDSTTYLHRGGRCSAIAAFGAAALGIKPSIVVENGRMHPDAKYQGSIGRALLKYAKKITPALLQADNKRVFITHSGSDQDVIDKVYQYVCGLDYFKEVFVTRAGCVVSSHCGYGTLGILFVDKP